MVLRMCRSRCGQVDFGPILLPREMSHLAGS